jgi:hypothetical protein
MILPSWSLIWFFLACIEAKDLEFVVGKKLIWIVDFRSIQPRGVFCSRLEASIVNAVVDLRTERPFRERIGQTMMQHQGLPSIFNVQVELGVVYRVEWIVRRPTWIPNGRYRLILDCVHPKYAPHILHDKYLAHFPRYIVAWTGPFILQEPRPRFWPTRALRNFQQANIVDISPKEHYIDNPDNACLISLDIPQKPVIDDFGHTFDLKDFLKFRRGNHQDTATCCLLKHDFRTLRVNERIFAYACRYEQSILSRIKKSSWWKRVPSLMQNGNIETEFLNALPEFDKNGLGLCNKNECWAQRLFGISSYRRTGRHVVIPALLLVANMFSMVLLNNFVSQKDLDTHISGLIRLLIRFSSLCVWLGTWLYLVISNSLAGIGKITERDVYVFVERVVSGYGYPDTRQDTPSMSSSFADIL